jgi:6,7-dimethyl-8-ribityllumazine synthase
MSEHAPQPLSPIDGAPFRIGVAAARYNPRFVDALLAQVTGQLLAAGVKAKNLAVVRVPGSNELPSALQLVAARGRFDCLVALGVIIRGGTMHHELIASGVTAALHQLSLAARTPVINGVIVVNSERQAVERVLGRLNRGAEFAQAALEMAALKRTSGGQS